MNPPSDTGSVKVGKRGGASRLLVGSTRVDVIVLGVVSAVLQVLYVFITKISFDCDALTFYNMAKVLSFQNAGFYPGRGLGYSIFLVLTGQTFLDTFYGTVWISALIGVAAPILVYLTLCPINRLLALTAAGLLIVSSLPFTYVKVMTPQHLFMIEVVSSIYYFSRFYFTRLPRFMYFSGALATLAVVTRGEAVALMLILPLLFTYLVWKYSVPLRQVATAAGVMVAVYLAHGTLRSVALKDPSLITSVSNWGGRQLFVQPYMLQRASVRLIRQRFVGSLPEGAPEPILVVPENGPASQRLYRLVLEEYSHPEAYSFLAPLLDRESVWGETSKFDTGGEIYYSLFGRFAGNAEALARNFFQNPSQVYFDNVFRLIDKRLGIVESNALFQQVALEAMAKNPAIWLAFAHNALWYAGLDLFGILERVTNHTSGSAIFRLQRSMDNYLDPFFDGAKCASEHLPASMFAEYKRDHFKAASMPGSVWNRTLRNLQMLRVNVATVAGILVLAFWWVLLFERHRVVWLALGLTLLLMVGIIGSGNGPGERYEAGIQPPILMIAAGCLYVMVGKTRTLIARRAFPRP